LWGYGTFEPFAESTQRGNSRRKVGKVTGIDDVYEGVRKYGPDMHFGAIIAPGYAKADQFSEGWLLQDS